MQGEAHPSKLALRERRERAISQLSESFARDAIDLEAFEARVDAVYCSRSLAECDALVADLGGSDASETGAIVVAQAELARSDPMGAVALAPPGPGASIPIVRAVFSNIERCDQVVMPRATRVEALFGNVEIDLRKATFVSGITEIRVKAIFSSIEIVVSADITVEVYGAGVFGNFEGTSRTIGDPDAPIVRIVGSATFASVVVRTLPPVRVQRLVEQLRAGRLPPPRGQVR